MRIETNFYPHLLSQIIFYIFAKKYHIYDSKNISINDSFACN